MNFVSPYDAAHLFAALGPATLRVGEFELERGDTFEVNGFGQVFYAHAHPRFSIDFKFRQKNLGGPVWVQGEINMTTRNGRAEPYTSPEFRLDDESGLPALNSWVQVVAQDLLEERLADVRPSNDAPRQLG